MSAKYTRLGQIVGKSGVPREHQAPVQSDNHPNMSLPPEHGYSGARDI